MTQEEQDYIEKHRVSLKDVPEGTVFWVFYEHFKVRSKVRGYVRLKGNRAKNHEGTVTPIFTTERYASGLVFVEDPTKCTPETAKKRVLDYTLKHTVLHKTKAVGMSCAPWVGGRVHSLQTDDHAVILDCNPDYPEDHIVWELAEMFIKKQQEI